MTTAPSDLPSPWSHPHWNDTMQYIAALTGVAVNPERVSLCWQTFDDGPEKRGTLARTIHGTFEDRCGELVRFNQDGAGIFVAVNAVPQGKPRKKPNITTARAWWCDVDLKEWPEADRAAFTWVDYMATLPLWPSIIVQSAGGPHCYWLASEDVAPEACEAVNKRIAVAARSDPKVAEWARVMRVPGFFHQKERGRPRLVATKLVEPARRYSLAQMEAKFPALPVAAPTTPSARHRDAADAGELVATLDRSQGGRVEALRVYLDADDGHPLIRLATWQRNDGVWEESRSVTMRWREVGRVADALISAAGRLESRGHEEDAA